MPTESYTELPLVTGGFPTYAEPETVKSGEGVLPKGTVMGRITATGKWVKSLKASNDGSEVARGILPEQVDATAADVKAPVYKAGTFNPAALTFGAGHDESTVKADFEGTPMFVRRPVADG